MPSLIVADPTDHQLYVTDGTTTTVVANAGTTPAFAQDPLDTNDPIGALTVGTLSYIIMADETGTTSALYKYDGTHIQQITSSSNYVGSQYDINQNNAPSLTTFNGNIVFTQESLSAAQSTAQKGSTTSLAIYNPTTGAITSPIVPNGGTNPVGFTVLGSSLYFIGTDNTTGKGALYAYNGTSVTEVAGTSAIAPTGGIAAFNDKIYFGDATSSLYQYDPNGSGVSLVSHLYPQGGQTNTSNFIVFNNKLIVLSPQTGAFSFDTNNNQSQFVSSIGAQSFSPVVYNGALYYTSYHVSGNTQVSALYKSTDGVNSTMVRDNVYASNFVVANGVLNFTSSSTDYNYDGTTFTQKTFAGSTGTTTPIAAAPYAVPSAIWTESSGSTEAAPVVATSAGSSQLVAVANATTVPVAVDPGITVTDADTARLSVAHVSLETNFQPGEDVLAFNNNNSTTFGNIAGAYNATTGVLTLTSAGASATVAQFQAALRAVTFTDTAASPSTAPRTIDFAVSDGTETSAAVTRQVTVSNYNPSRIVFDSSTQPVSNDAQSHGDDTSFADGGSSAFSFTSASDSTGTLSDLKVRLGDATPGDGGSTTFYLYSNSGSGANQAPGTRLATLGTIADSSLSTGGALVDIPTGTAANLAAGTRYWIEFTDSSTSQTFAQFEAGSAGTGVAQEYYTYQGATYSNSGGGVDIAQVTETVALADQAPVVTTSAGSSAFVAGDNTASTPVVVDPGATVSDLDNTSLASATVAITGNFSAADVLGFTASATTGNIAGAYNATTGVLTLTSAGATATVAQFGAALDAVTFTDTAVTPTTGTRTLSFSASDGTQTSAVATKTVTVTDTDQTPIVTTSAGSSAFVAGDNTASTPVVVDPGATVSDLDNTSLASATVAITGNFSAADVLGFTASATTGNIAGAYNATTGVLTLTSAGATATVAQFGAALDAVTFTDTAVTPTTGTRTLSFSASDGTQTSAVATKTVTVTDTDQTPIVTTSAGSSAFVAGDNTASTPVVVDPGATVSDLDNTSLASATVAITGNFSAADVLGFTASATTGNIAGAYNATTGVLTLTSAGATATVAQFGAALDAVTFTDTAVTPTTGTRTLSFSASDGTQTSAVATKTVTVTDTDQTPIVTTSAGSSAFVAGDNTASTPVVVDPGATVSDLDNTTLASATVAITGNFSAADVLGFTASATTGNIAGAYNATTGVLTLTSAGATATVAQFGAALDAVTFTDTAVTPTTGTRTLSLSASDGTQTSAVATKTVTVTDTDQTPIVTGGGTTVGYTEAGRPTTVGATLTATDRDSANLTSATVTITAGFLAGDVLVAATAGTGITATYNGAGTLTLTGAATLTNYDKVLDSVAFSSTTNDPTNGAASTSRTLSIAVSDGTKFSASVIDTVTVTPTNDAPTAIAPSGYATTEQQVLDLKATGLSVADPDSHGGVETATLTVGAGILTVAAGTSGATVTGSGSTGVSIVGTIAQIDALLATDASSAVSYADTSAAAARATTLTLSINDGGHTGPSPASALTGTAQSTITVQVPVPTVAIDGGNVLTNQATQTVSGTASTSGAGTLYVQGTTVSIYDNGAATPIGTATVQGDGTWTSTVTLAHGDNVLVAQDVDNGGTTGTSASVTDTFVDVSSATLDMLSATGNPNANVDSVTDPGTVTVPAGTDLLVVDTPAGAAALDALPRGPDGSLAPSDSDATTIYNPDNPSLQIVAESSTFLTLASGLATVIGADAPTFIVDATSDSSNVTIEAGSGRSFLLAGSGNDKLTGSTSATGTAALVGGSGADSLYGGLGADSLYGGGHSLLQGGSGAGQVLAGGFSPTAEDTLVAGTGGGEILAVSQGNNLLNDAASPGGDTLFSGTGSDTLIGSANGTTYSLGRGNVTLEPGSPNDRVFLSDATSDVSALDALVRAPDGSLAPSDADETVINNLTATPLHIQAGTSVFLGLASGAATVSGGNAHTFIVDASHNAADLDLQAGSGRAFLLAGAGNDVLSGSTSSAGTAVLVAGSGGDTLMGGAGSDTLYAGGHSLLQGGTGAGQVLAGGFSPSAADTLVAGSGGGETLAVSQGNNLLNDAASPGNDTLFSGTGSDTLMGSASGTTFSLGQGHATVQGGAGDDSIFVAKGPDATVIDGGGGKDFVTFAGYGHADATVTTSGDVTTVNFSGTGQSATLTHVTSIYFGNDTPTHA